MSVCVCYRGDERPIQREKVKEKRYEDREQKVEGAIEVDISGKRERVVDERQREREREGLADSTGSLMRWPTSLSRG